MAEQTEIKPADTKAAAIQAWNDAATISEKSAVVKQYPILVELYALAANLVTQ
jgi:hypothetical protein